MSGDERGPVRRPRTVARPQVPSGPLRDLKDLLYELYVAAGTPTLDTLAALVAADDNLAGSPERDTIRRALGSTELPANQSDAVALATVLARAAGWDQRDAAARTCELWIQAKLAVPLGRPIADLTDPIALEVHPAIDAGAEAAGLPVLPPYIRREHDDRLSRISQQAATGRSVIVILVGESSTGKTRACWEAIRSLPPEWRLWHPIDPGRPQAAAEGLKKLGAHTVLWLNEIQHYLLTPDSGLGEQVAAGLRELLLDVGRAPILVLGTIWPKYWDTLTAGPNDGEYDPHAQSRALLTTASIRIPDAFTAELVQVARSQADPRLIEAAERAEDGQVAQYLAGVPVLVERYHNAPVVARAVMDAAIDARRMGHGLFLPRSLLEMAAPAYCT